MCSASRSRLIGLILLDNTTAQLTKATPAQLRARPEDCVHQSQLFGASFWIRASIPDDQLDSAAYYGHPPAICGYQNRDIDWVAGENVIGVLCCEHERGINRISSVSFRKQRPCLASDALVNRKHIDRSQETRYIRLDRLRSHR
jgi:hypothetical protein